MELEGGILPAVKAPTRQPSAFPHFRGRKPKSGRSIRRFGKPTATRSNIRCSWILRLGAPTKQGGLHYSFLLHKPFGVQSLTNAYRSQILCRAALCPPRWSRVVDNDWTCPDTAGKPHSLLTIRPPAVPEHRGHGSIENNAQPSKCKFYANRSKC